MKRPSSKVTNRIKGNQPKVFIGGIFEGGAGIVITIDVWGRPHIKRVPPRQPDVMRLSAASALLAQADKISSRTMRKQMTALAEQIVKEALPGLQARFGR